MNGLQQLTRQRESLEAKTKRFASDLNGRLRPLGLQVVQLNGNKVPKSLRVKGPFKCPQCDAEFPLSQNLGRHMGATGHRPALKRRKKRKAA